MTIRENIESYQDALTAVKQHCMCVRFEDLGGAYRVLYAPGFRLDGVQAVYAKVGKRAALERMLNAMERHWRDEY